MTGFLNITVNIILATIGPINPAVAEQPIDISRYTDVSETTLKYQYAEPGPDLFGVDFDARQMERVSRLV